MSIFKNEDFYFYTLQKNFYQKTIFFDFFILFFFTFANTFLNLTVFFTINDFR